MGSFPDTDIDPEYQGGPPFMLTVSMANPDLELRRGGGRFFVACPAGFSSFCDSFFFFLAKIRGGGVG